MFATKFDFTAKPLLTSDLFVSAYYVPPTDWFDALSVLLDEVESPFWYLDALLMNLLEGDAVGVLMVKHLLAWLPHSIRKADGAIWRKAEEWSSYCGITENQVYNAKRRARLEHVGFEIWTEKAMGENQLHFKLDPARFTARIAEALGIASRQIHALVWGKRDYDKVGPVEKQVGSVQNKVRPVEKQIPLTDNTTKNTTKNTTNTKDIGAIVSPLILLSSVDEIFDGLVTGGLMSSVDRIALTGMRREDVVACLSSLEVATGVKNPQRYLRASLFARKKDADVVRSMVSDDAHIPQTVLPEVSAEVDEKPSWWRGFMWDVEAKFPVSSWSYARRLEFAGEGEGVVRLKRPDDIAEAIFLPFKRNFEAILKTCRGEMVTVEFVV